MSRYRAPNWKKRIRRILIEKYGSVCMICFTRVLGRKLTIHHIKPISEYPKLKKKVKNCLLLCLDCHRDLDDPKPVGG